MNTILTTTTTTTITTTRPLNEEYQRRFAICESCFWCATIFHKAQSSDSNIIIIIQHDDACPVSESKSISLIPLAKDEGYTIAMEAKRGLEMEFPICSSSR
jgi:hypothetical protein